MKKLLMFVLTGFLMAGLTHAAEKAPIHKDSMRALWEEMRNFQQQEQEYRRVKQGEMKTLQEEIMKLRAEREKASDEAAKKASWEKLMPLEKKKIALIEEVGLHEVQSAERDVQFAMKRLEIAKAKMTSFQQEKLKFEQKMALGTAEAR